MHAISKNLFREYDIRGIVPGMLNADNAKQIAQAYATAITRACSNPHPKICLGWDGRLSSPELKTAIGEGLQLAGAEVLEVGLGPTPLTYFSVFHEQADGCIMITGSHNPPDYNGMKMMVGSLPFFGADIQTLHAMLSAGDVAAGQGSIRQLSDIKKTYLAMLKSAAKLGTRDLNVVWDAGNGASGEIVQALAGELPGTHHVLFGEIDGHFPNHHPDPSEPHNLIDLQREVLARGADIGIAFDGDGDRIGVIDAKGRILAGDQILSLCARDMLKRYPGATVIADVKTSKAVFEDIKSAGGVPLMWKTGHSNIKSKMKETGAKLAGEMSGHMFFADEYYGFDDAIYAAIRVLNILANSNETLVQMVDAMPKLHNTPEIRIDCDDDRKFQIMHELAALLKEERADFSDVDGVRVNTPDGWWLMRASNTQPVLVARAEAATQVHLENLLTQMRQRMKLFGIDMPT